LALPLSVATELDTPLAATVVTVGAAAVVNDSTTPNDVPMPLLAIAQ
jgi:hypothetical protein